MTEECGCKGMEQFRREVRRARMWSIGSILVGAFAGSVGLAFGQDRPRVIRSERFELVNDAGAIVGAMGTQDGAYPYLELNRSDSQGAGGKVRMDVPYRGGPSCSLYDNAGKKRMQLYLGSKVTKRPDEGRPIEFGQLPHILLFDDEEKIVAEFGSALNGLPEIVLKDENHEVVVKLPK